MLRRCRRLMAPAAARHEYSTFPPRLVAACCCPYDQAARRPVTLRACRITAWANRSPCASLEARLSRRTEHSGLMPGINEAELSWTSSGWTSSSARTATRGGRDRPCSSRSGTQSGPGYCTRATRCPPPGSWPATWAWPGARTRPRRGRRNQPVTGGRRRPAGRRLRRICVTPADTANSAAPYGPATHSGQG